MKKRIALSLILILALASPSGAAGNRAPGENILRLHIVASSDSPFDQSVKLAVRDAVLRSGQALSRGVDSSKEARAALMDGGAELLAAAEGALMERGAHYGAELRLGVYDFPDRQYRDAFYPAGRYEALRVILGDGAGRNWWCVMFPPLCILELPSGEIDPEELRTNSLIAELIKSIDGGKLWKKLIERLR